MKTFNLLGTISYGFSLLLIAGLSLGGATAFAAAPNTVCNFNSVCVNRNGGCNNTNGNCSVIGWHEDDDNNENATLTGFNPCNSGDLVTQTCPFVVESGFNSANAGDGTLQIVMYNASGSVAGCVGTTTSNGNTYLLPCANQAGSGRGTGTMWVYGSTDTSGSKIIPNGGLGNRYWTDYFYTPSKFLLGLPVLNW